jgi:D-sedoheptulose 7-phosphate isomerase
MTAGDTARRALVIETLATTARLHAALADGPAVEAIARAGDTLVQVLAAGGQVLAFGNGGSAADAAALRGGAGGAVRASRGGRFPALALTTDPSIADGRLANDFGFEAVFARQVEALGRAGDLAGGHQRRAATRPNVDAPPRGGEGPGACVTVALTGNDGGAAGRLAEVHVNVPAGGRRRGCRKRT